jgi:SAM-dependent methyltransferase
MNNYIEKNRAGWNSRTEYHVNSDFYNLPAFLKGASSLSDMELAALGDPKGKSVLHLQCHFGMDSISIARMGAEVTGADLSDKAIEKAKELAAQTGSSTQFVCCDLYDLSQHLDKQFDMVFTSCGAIGWLPDLDKWAKVIAHFLKPDGKLVFVEFHPVVWIFDNDFTKIEYSYFNVEDIEETTSGTYADKNAPIITETVSWNHPLTDVMQGLLRNGMELQDFKEYDYSPYNCFNNTVETSPKKFHIKGMEGKLPMMYSIVAVKK